MKLLTLYTEKHEKKLRSFLETAPVLIRSRGHHGSLFYVRLAYESKETFFVDALTHFLEDIVLYDNQVYRYSPKLCHAASFIRETGVHNEMKEQLTAYLKHNKTLHIEGYTAFRMDAYKYKLDILSYSLIKKLKLIEY